MNNISSNEDQRGSIDVATGDGADEGRLDRAFSIIADTPTVDAALEGLRDFLGVDHLVYHSSKLGTSPSADPYVRFTYPLEWIGRYLQMNYVDLDPVVREGFHRTMPFDWSELKVETPQEFEFLNDALAHGVGPFGMSIPVRSKQGHRALVSMSFSRSEEEWAQFRQTNLSLLIEIANRLHRRVISELFGEDHPHLSDREIECLHWTALGKEASEIAIILRISPHTVRDYLKSARFKLDCVTSAQAVTKAAKLGLLTL